MLGKDIRRNPPTMFESLGDCLRQDESCSVPLLDLIASSAIGPSRPHEPISEMLNCLRIVQRLSYLVQQFAAVVRLLSSVKEDADGWSKHVRSEEVDSGIEVDMSDEGVFKIQLRW